MKLDRSTQLQRALEQLGRDPTRLEERLDKVMTQTGATAAELRAALGKGDRFGGDHRKALEALLDQRLRGPPAGAGASTAQGARAHVVRARKHKPWYGAVKGASTLGAVLFPEPPRDVELAGEKLSRDALAELLRGAA